MRKKILDLYRLKYQGLNIAHFREKFLEVENISELPS